ncbi:MAG: radical SAM protein [Candidatus Aenigmarchaeota archaeon]|nr:radical SAM protein [Candidatus Aenigmarchaeota archaeon]
MGKKLKDYVLRISVTSNCNLNCFYCSKHRISQSEIMSDSELLEIITSAVNAGVKIISWTGGEPTVRKNFIDIVKKAKALGIEKQTITTNGVKLHTMINSLKKAGINRCNISLDTLNPDKYQKITGKTRLSDVLKSIDACTKLYNNTKINCVITNDNFHEIDKFVDFCEKYKGKLTIRFLELVPCGEAFGHDSTLFDREYVSSNKVLQQLKKFGKMEPIINSGNVPKSKYYKIKGLKGIYGVNPNESVNYHCDREKCVKIRVSPNGYVSNCTIQLKYTRKFNGKSLKEKIKLMKEIVDEKSKRNFDNFQHKQKYYDFWRFGIMSDEVKKILKNNKNG